MKLQGNHRLPCFRVSDDEFVAIGVLFCLQTVLKSLYDSVDKEHAPNYSLLMLWASLANAIPVSEKRN